MTVNYFIIKGKNEYCSIYLRIRATKLDVKAKTGLTVLHKNWSKAKQKVKDIANTTQKEYVNDNLKRLRVCMIEKYNKDINEQKHVNSNWVRNTIDEFFNRIKEDALHKVYFLDWYKLFIDNIDKRIYKGKLLAKSTKFHYKNTYKKLLAFEKHKKTKFKHQDITLDFYREFLNYCRNVERLNDNSIGKYISKLKIVCKGVEMDGLPISQHFKHSEFMTISEKAQDIYLTENEINKIYKFDFKEDLRLDRSRDLFIIGLRTGLRVSDFLRIKEANIKQGYIEITTQKTGQNVVIPLHAQTKAILSKYNGSLPKPISSQKFNAYIKEVCKAVGINQITKGAKMIDKRKAKGEYPKYELVTSHTCRRSFATNLYGKLPPLTIMAITGHKTETQFLKYIKITPKEHAKTLQKHWANEQKENGYTNVLTIEKTAN